VDINYLKVNAGDKPYIVNRFKGQSLLVMGAGYTLWEDLAKIWNTHKGHLMAVNRVILDFADPIEHAVGCHPYELLLFSLWRREHYPSHEHMYTHSCRIYDEASYEAYLIPQFLWDFPDYYHGSSTLTGVLAGLVMGYEEIILAGVPMEGSYYCCPFWQYPYEDAFMKDWEKAAKNSFDGKVKSLSGKTRELLGAPKGF
jgi:hypothetical protein